MKILETIFLCLTVIVPVGLGLIMAMTIKKKKYRRKMMLFMLIALILNGAIFGGLKMYNKSREDKNIVKEPKENTKGNDTKKENPEEKDPIEKQPKNEVTSKGFTIETKNGITYVDGYLVVNKTYPLPEDYIPAGTHKTVAGENCQDCIIEEGYEAYTRMKQDAASEGMTLWIASGYRSYKYQNSLYTGYVKRSGKTAADTYSARPGHSEHQSGYAFDLNSVNDSFANTKEGKWIADNCYKYGFIIRYPKGKDDETGYKYEPWHLRYVGLDLATKLYNAGEWITMEDYFGITSQYR